MKNWSAWPLLGQKVSTALHNKPFSRTYRKHSSGRFISKRDLSVKQLYNQLRKKEVYKFASPYLHPKDRETQAE